MAMSIFTRCSRFRCLLGISNNATVLSSNAAEYTNSVRCIKSSCTTSADITDDLVKESGKKYSGKISKAMLAYLQRARQHDQFMKKEILEYEIGKRHLANMMGEDPETFTQEDIDRSIEYLFPSGLFEPLARPMMKHPNIIFPNRKEAEFDETGRPFHSMFYTSKPNYYEMLYNIVDMMKSLNDIEDTLIKQGTLSPNKIDLISSAWLSKQEIEDKLLETITDTEYTYLIASLERLSDHSQSKHATDLIIKYRKPLVAFSKKVDILPLKYDSTGRPYITVKNCMRKSARGEVTIWGNGTGKITINGHNITYFEDLHHREQIIFPLILTDMTHKVDVDATINGGGPTGQSGAIRWGIAWGLRSFVDASTIERMRVAGLLTRDWRRRERKKFGQEGARRKFTWKKR